ncbi:hypothetical protein [Amycolatopsis anabasis]|uniref:hypothetical protein n=1 Tax=Amycolatopsis anabasis TaxID=1840409 RepID=UPI00131BCC19|nr:hypothetical protein [Amycolatopsis anabasis]
MTSVEQLLQNLLAAKEALDQCAPIHGVADAVKTAQAHLQQAGTGRYDEYLSGAIEGTQQAQQSIAALEQAVDQHIAQAQQMMG